MNTKEPQNRGISELVLEGVFSSGKADNKWITLKLGFPMTTKPFSVLSTLQYFPSFHTIPKDQNKLLKFNTNNNCFSPLLLITRMWDFSLTL